MSRRKQVVVRKIGEGDFIFLKGRQVIAKWEVEKIVDGQCYMFMHGPVRKTYVHPQASFVVGSPLFKRGLRAFPNSSLLERDWKALQARGEMMALFREVNRLKSRIPKIRNSRKIISCVDVLKTFIQEFKQAMKSK